MRLRRVLLGTCTVLIAAALIWSRVSRHGAGRAESARPRPAAGASERTNSPLKRSLDSGGDGAPPSRMQAIPQDAGGRTSVCAFLLESLPAEWRERVLHFEDAGVPVATRIAELAKLAKKGDGAAAAILMALGNEHTYLNYAAVQALGGVKAEGVAEYLAGKLADPDPRVVCAAVKSLVQQRGDAALGDIAATVKANRQRPDGFEDTVCAACAEALGEMRSAKAVPVLDAELRETVGVTLQYEYGSQVVRALAATGRPEARPVLLAYAERLTRELPKYDDNPMGKRFIEGKIAEARQAALGLGGP